MPSTLRLTCALFAVAFANGCGRTVLVSDGTPMRIGPDCRASVYTWDGTTWNLSANRVAIPEGWYVLPPSVVDDPRDE